MYRGSYRQGTTLFQIRIWYPGIAVCACSDGKERLIPSFALDGFQKSDYPAQDNTGKELFVGKPCCS